MWDSGIYSVRLSHVLVEVKDRHKGGLTRPFTLSRGVREPHSRIQRGPYHPNSPITFEASTSQAPMKIVTSKKPNQTYSEY